MNISRRKANHEAFISLETFERIQQRRSNNAYLPMRKDINKDFVLRGAACCSECSSASRHSFDEMFEHSLTL